LVPSLGPSGSGAGSAAMLLTDFFNNSSKARTHSFREYLYWRTTTGAMFRPLPLIAIALASWNRQPLNLAAGYLLKLGFPALSGLGDE